MDEVKKPMQESPSAFRKPRLTPRGGTSGLFDMAKLKKNSKSKPKNHKGGHRTKITPALIDKFITLLANNGGIVVDAANDVGIARNTLYDRRADDEGFRERWDEAIDRGVEVLEDAAKRRALEGDEEPVYHQGMVVGTVHRRSDYLMGLLLKGYRSRFRTQTHEVDANVRVGIDGIAELFEGIETAAIKGVLKALQNGNHKKGKAPVVSRL